MASVTKKVVVQTIAEKLKIHPEDAKKTIQAFFDEVVYQLGKGKRLEFREFGIFETVTRKKKIGRNPKNAKATIVIPERQAVKFTAGKRMKEAVDQLNQREEEDGQ